MVDAIKKHTGYYTSLFVILTLAGFLVLYVSYNRQLQTLVVLITAFLYVLYGILHHLINHDLSAKIVIEYILIGSLGMAIVLFLI